MEIYALLAVIIFILQIGTTIEADPKGNTDSYLTTTQIIQKYGYPAEAHTVQTADGYLLTIHRIPNRKHALQEEDSENSVDTKPPILMQHGLLGSSADFVLLASKNSLAFLLADLGYDVWLGNTRGNRYTRAHASLFPNTKKFWNFTWHESAVYDMPAQIDFICNRTKQEKLVYVGFSMGTTVFFAMMSSLPQYSEKIELSLMMAPVAYAKNIRSILLRFLTVVSEKFKDLVELIENGEFLPDSKLLKILSRIFCEKNDVEKRLCRNAIFLIVGSDPKEFDKDLLPVLSNNYPTGYSAKGVNHYAQLVKSGKFRQYDYGRDGNLRQYGSPSPPDYNLSLIQSPMYFYVGQNDYLSTLPDVNHLAKELSTLKKLHVIDYPKFSHLDFIFSVDVKKLIYDTLINDLTAFSRKSDCNIAPGLLQYAKAYAKSFEENF